MLTVGCVRNLKEGFCNGRKVTEERSESTKEGHQGQAPGEEREEGGGEYRILCVENLMPVVQCFGI